MTLTDKAIRAVNRFVTTSESNAVGLRIIISSACCNSLQYGLRLEQRAQPDDKVLEYGAVKVFIDQKSVPLIDGATIDFVDDREASGFRFTNLNAKKPTQGSLS